MTATTSDRPMSDPAPRRPEPTRRLFFALWPDAAVLEALLVAMHRLVPPGIGRPQRRDQLHLTLEFLGGVPQSRLASVLDAGAALAGKTPRFEILFDRVDYWKRPEVLCLTADATPEPLVELVQLLRTQLIARGFEPEKRPFKAHLTLARKVRRPPPLAAIEPLAWRAHEFSLVESTSDSSGSRYDRLASWPLGA